MREFGKIAPQLWIGETARKLRGDPGAQVVQVYLLTGPNARAIGIYYIPIQTISHETGIPFKGASKALARLIEVGFCQYDYPREIVFVPQMARFQIGDTLKPGDKRGPWIRKELEPSRKSPFLREFLELYREAYHLSDLSPLGDPPESLRSKEQEREKEIEQEKDLGLGASHLGQAEGSTAPALHSSNGNGNGNGRALEKLTAQDLADGWNDHCVAAGYAKVEVLSTERKQRAARRLAEQPTKEFWERVFGNMKASLFLRGFKSPRKPDEKPFKADFDWLIANSNNCVKIFEGKYNGQ